MCLEPAKKSSENDTIFRGYHYIPTNYGGCRTHGDCKNNEACSAGMCFKADSMFKRYFCCIGQENQICGHSLNSMLGSRCKCDSSFPGNNESFGVICEQ